MPQEIRVVKCVQCEMFQTDIVKKANKWQCTLCGLKQSLRKEYYRGTGADCRLRVQVLNLNQGTKHNHEMDTTLEIVEDENWQTEKRLEEENRLLRKLESKRKPANKWAKFVDEQESPRDRTCNKDLHKEAFHSTSSPENTPAANSAIKRKSEINANTNAKKANSRWQEFL